MKILLPLLLVLCFIETAFSSSRYVTLFASSVEVSSTDIVKIVGVGHDRTFVSFSTSDNRGFQVGFNVSQGSDNRGLRPVSHIFTGLKQVSVSSQHPVTLKITPAAVNVTTSKPVIVPPTSVSDTKWNVQLQVSTDLSNWEDVAPGEFLGSNTARFFRIKTTSGNPEE